MRTSDAEGFPHGRMAASVGAGRGRTIVVDGGTNGIDDAIVGDVASDEMMGITEAIKPVPEDGEPTVGLCSRNAKRPWQRQQRRGYRHPLTRSNKQGMERIDG